MRRIAGIGLLLTASVLTACGEDGDDGSPEPNGVAEMSPSEALAAADEAMEKLSDATYRAEGRVDRDGPRGTIVLTMVRGAGCQVTIRSPEDGTLIIRELRGGSFVQVDEKAARQQFDAPPAAVDRIAGKWITRPGDVSDLDQCSLDDLVPPERWYDGFEADGTDTISGKEARAFTGRTNDGRITLWIATVGKPVVLRFAESESEGLGAFTTTLFDTGLDLNKPAPADVIRLS